MKYNSFKLVTYRAGALNLKERDMRMLVIDDDNITTEK
jgi:hypothetical protein